MAALMKPFRVIRNHWKKSLFGALLLGYGANYGLHKYECYQIMRVYCQEAAKYGIETTTPTEKCRHVTVLLNPVANDNNGEYYILSNN